MEHTETSYTVRYGMFPTSYLDGYNVFAPMAMPTLENAAPHYIDLMHHVVREGFRNPIMVIDRDPVNKLHKWIPYGRSRFWVAQQLGINVPAFVVDYRANWTHWVAIDTVEQVYDLCKDRPYMVRFEPTEFIYAGCAQVHLTGEMRIAHEAWQRGRDERRYGPIEQVGRDVSS